MDWIPFYSVFFVPLLLCFGAGALWLVTREISALIMALGFLPAILSVVFAWWGPHDFVKIKNGATIPSEAMFDFSLVLGQLSALGTTMSGVAFLVFVWRVRSYEKPGT